MKLKENSFIYKYLTGFYMDDRSFMHWDQWYDEKEGVMRYNRTTDTCSVVNRFFGMTFLYVIWSGVFFLMEFLLGSTVAWYAACTLNDFACFSDTAPAEALATTFFGVLALIVVGIFWIAGIVSESDKFSTPKFIKDCIESKKEKICKKIEVIQD